jgi:hypothetical protein
MLNGRQLMVIKKPRPAPCPGWLKTEVELADAEFWFTPQSRRPPVCNIHDTIT